jgi:PKHD-type hydroxylase
MSKLIYSWRFELDKIHPYAWHFNLFTKEECEKIIEIGEKYLFEDGKVGGGVKNQKIRESTIAWINPNEYTNWFYSKIVASILDLNKQFFGFDLTGLYEGLQFTKYISPNGKYDKHTDRAYNTGIRKLSITVQLSDPKKEKGGDLLIYDGGKATKIKKQQGTLYAFPSFQVHEVSKITKGTRYSLVAWVGGPNFK